MICLCWHLDTTSRGIRYNTHTETIVCLTECRRMLLIIIIITVTYAIHQIICTKLNHHNRLLCTASARPNRLPSSLSVWFAAVCLFPTIIATNMIYWFAYRNDYSNGHSFFGRQSRCMPMYDLLLHMCVTCITTAAGSPIPLSHRQMWLLLSGQILTIV